MKYALCFLLVAMLLSACSKHKPQATDLAVQELLDKTGQYIQAEHLDSALLILYPLLPRLKTDSTSLQQISALKYMGTVYDIRGKYDSASYYLYQALRLAEKTNTGEMHIRILCDLGILYFNLGKASDAINYYEQMLEMARKLNDTINIIRAMNNMGNTYATLNHDFAKAIPCFEKSIGLGEKIGYTEAVRMSKTTLVQIYTETGEIDKAYRLAVDVKKRYGDNPYTSFVLADIHRKKGEQEQAIAIYKQVLDSGTGFDSQELRMALLDGLYQAYSENRDYENALKYCLQGRMVKDSLHTVQSEKNIQNLKIAYETEKKEIKINDLEKEKRLYVWLGVTGGVVLLLALAFFIVGQRLAVSSRKLAEQQVKQLEQEKQLVAAQAALDGETAERTRLAKDLHDGLGGMLSVVKLNLPNVKSGVILETQEVERFQTAMVMLDQSISELRRVAHHMMPDSLMRYGLKAALSDFCNAIPVVQFHYYGNDRRLDSKLEILVYRSAHELVNNALKHSGAMQINVQLVQDNDRVSLTVQDNGCGFDTSNTPKGMGLENIRNRVETYNGYINLYSSEGNGTEANIEFQT